jgi:transposase InsO family protein
MDCASDHRGVSLEWGPALPYPRSGPHLWRYRRTPFACHGIRDKPIAPSSPWQNGFAERLIGSIRRACVDHLIVLGEAHLHRVLRSYAQDYNQIRTYRSLDKDAPLSRAIQRIGLLKSQPILGGLHHHYVRI